MSHVLLVHLIMQMTQAFAQEGAGGAGATGYSAELHRQYQLAEARAAQAVQDCTALAHFVHPLVEAVSQVQEESMQLSGVSSRLQELSGELQELQRMMQVAEAHEAQLLQGPTPPLAMGSPTLRRTVGGFQETAEQCRQRMQRVVEPGVQRLKRQEKDARYTLQLALQRARAAMLQAKAQEPVVSAAAALSQLQQELGREPTSTGSSDLMGLTSEERSLWVAQEELRHCQGMVSCSHADSQFTMAAVVFQHMGASAEAETEEHSSTAAANHQEAAAAVSQADTYMTDSTLALKAGRLQDSVAARFSAFR